MCSSDLSEKAEKNGNDKDREGKKVAAGEGLISERYKDVPKELNHNLKKINKFFPHI